MNIQEGTQRFTTPSWLLFAVCFSFLLTITFLLSIGYESPSVAPFLVSCFALASVILTIGRRSWVALPSALVLGCSLAFVRVHLELYKQNPALEFVGVERSYIGTVTSVDRTAQSVRIRVSDSTIDGDIIVITDAYSPVMQGDRATFTCSSRLDQRDRMPLCLFPRITQETTRSRSPYALLEKTREAFVFSIRRSIPEPASSFVVGVLVGKNAGLDSRLVEVFRRTGTAHLVALSGFNVTLIAGYLTLLFYWIALPRRLYVWIIAVVLTLFVLMVGAEPSLVRASIMGVLVVLARQLGRTSTPRNLLAFTAACMVAHDPSILLFDVGFQLSFAATVGVIYFYPLLERMVPGRSILQLKEALLMSVAAELFVMPLVSYHFGQFVPFSPLVNVLAAPPVPFIMLGGFITGLLGFVWPLLSLVTGWVTWIVASAVIWVITSVSEIAQPVELSVPIGAVIGYYSALAVLTVWLSTKVAAITSPRQSKHQATTPV